MVLKKFVLFVMLGVAMMAQAQVEMSNEVHNLNGKQYYVHIVKAGQTVYSITKAYGVKEYEAVLKSDIHHLSVGDTVWIPYKGQTPVQSKQSYEMVKVEPGQTMYSLSKTYEISIEDLYELNPELKASGLKAGQTIKVPAGKSKTTASTATTVKPTPTNQQPKPTTPTKPSRQPAQYTPKPPAEPAVIKPLIDPSRIHVSLLMPLHLSDLEKISTTKFDVDQRGKKTYGAFEYIQFYEGLLLGLERLERIGFKVVLNVVDVSGTTKQDVETAINTHNVVHSDFLIALLPKEQFDAAADWAQRNQMFVINPLSERGEIVEGNPYVIKCMSSQRGQVKSLLSAMKKMSGKPHLYVITSGAKAEVRMRAIVEEELEAQSDVAYTFFDWSANSKLVQTLKKTPNAVVLNIYDMNRDKNRIQVSTLLNRLAAAKSASPSLVSFDNYLNKYGDIDFMQLQNANYITVNTDLDFNDPAKKDFIEAFNAHFKTDPIGSYAPMANDIIVYFVYGLRQKGADFWRMPNQTIPTGVLYPLHFAQSESGHGFENETAVFYKLTNFHFAPLSGRY